MKKLTWILCLTLSIFLLAGCGADDDKNNNDNLNDNDMMDTQVVALYFAERDKHELVKEDRSIMIGTGTDASNTEGMAKILLEELVKGPTESRCSPILPKETKITSVKVENGLATVDLSTEVTEKYDNEIMESGLTVNGIVATLTRLDGVDRVKLTVGGKTFQLGETEIKDEYTVDSALQRQIDILDGKVVDDVINEGEDVVDDMIEGGREVVDDMKDAGREMVHDGKEMMEDGKNAVKNSLNMDNNANNNNNTTR